MGNDSTGQPGPLLRWLGNTEPLTKKQRLIAWVATAAFVLAAVFVIGKLFFSGPSHTEAGSERAPSINSDSVRSPGLDEWLAAVCKPGTYRGGVSGVLRNADGNGTCLSRTGGTPILGGQYASDFLMRNDMALYKGANYATGTMESGNLQLFLAPGGAFRNLPNDLAPLAQYGFTLGSVPLN